jgi:hypothetical protein
MRTAPSTSTIVPFPSASRSFGRRPLKSYFGQLTCLVLVRHAETEKALFVSDDGDKVGAVWVPRALLSIDGINRGPFLVATMSQQFATQKHLQVRFIDPQKHLAHEAELLAEAISVAARTRLRLRGSQQPLPFPGRNAWA